MSDNFLTLNCCKGDGDSLSFPNNHKFGVSLNDNAAFVRHKTLKRILTVKEIIMQEIEYSVGFELMNGNITAWSSLENRYPYPFGEHEFNRFFQHFFDMSFKFPGDFRCIIIYEAKENAPRHSYANGWMFDENLDEVNRYFRTRGEFPKIIGEISFEYGGNITPRITVKKR